MIYSYCLLNKIQWDRRKKSFCCYNLYIWSVSLNQFYRSLIFGHLSYLKAISDRLISWTDCKINMIVHHIVFYFTEKREDPFSLLIRYISMMGIRIMDLFRMFDTENGASVSKANFIRGLKVLINSNWFVIT